MKTPVPAIARLALGFFERVFVLLGRVAPSAARDVRTPEARKTFRQVCVSGLARHGMTGLAAHEIGQDDAGVLAPGRRADLLVCREDVIADPARLDAGALLEVVKDGVGYRGAIEALPQRDYATNTRGALALPPR